VKTVTLSKHYRQDLKIFH